MTEETHYAEEQAKQLGAWQSARNAIASWRKPVDLTPEERQKAEFEGVLVRRGNVYAGTAANVEKRRARNRVARKSRKINVRRSK